MYVKAGDLGTQPITSPLWQWWHPVTSNILALHQGHDIPGRDACPGWARGKVRPAQILLAVLNRNCSTGRRPWHSCYGELLVLPRGLIFKIYIEINHLGVQLHVLEMRVRTSKVMVATTSCCKASKTVFCLRWGGQKYLFSVTVVSSSCCPSCSLLPAQGCGHGGCWAGWLPSPRTHKASRKPGWCTGTGQRLFPAAGQCH